MRADCQPNIVWCDFVAVVETECPEKEEYVRHAVVGLPLEGETAVREAIGVRDRGGVHSQDLTHPMGAYEHRSPRRIVDGWRLCDDPLALDRHDADGDCDKDEERCPQGHQSRNEVVLHQSSISPAWSTGTHKALAAVPGPLRAVLRSWRPAGAAG